MIKSNVQISWLSDQIKSFLKFKTEKVLLENFLSLSMLQVANYLFPLITLPYLVRVLGPEKYGLIAFANAFVGYFMILTDYGFNLSATREISINRDDEQKVSEIFGSVMIIKLFLFVISFLFMSAIIFLFEKFRSDWILYYSAFGMVLGNIMFPAWFFQGVEKMKFITVLNLLAKLIFTVSIFIFVRKQVDYFLVPLLNSLGFIVAGVVSLYIIFKDFKIKFIIPTKQQIVHQFKEGWYIFVSTIAISLYTTSRVFIVGIFTNNIITGYYAIAEKLMNIFKTFPLFSFLQAVYPRLSEIYQKNKLQAFLYMKKLQKITTATYLCFCVFLFLSSKIIVLTVSGGRYTETINAFRLLSIAIFFISANAFRVQFLLVSGDYELFSRIHVAISLFGFFLLIVLTKLFNYIGTALSIIVIELGVLIYTIWITKRLNFEILDNKTK
ncbi:MAG: flippase [Candidatus Pacearchaeota archaeon]